MNKYICCFMRATHTINNIYKLISFFELIEINTNGLLYWKIQVEFRVMSKSPQGFYLSESLYKLDALNDFKL